MLSCSHLHKSFDGITALADVTIDLAKGRTIAIIGPNGAGKTTLFNVICGFVRPDRGQCRVDGQVVTGLPPHRVARKGLARTFQQVTVVERLSVLENVLLSCSRQAGFWQAMTRIGVTRQEERVREQARECLRMVGLDDERSKPAGSLSYGQRKLLTLAVAVAADVALLLLDEPFSGVDPVLAERVAETITNMRERGRLVVIIEHDVDAVKRVADEVIVMSDGKVIAHGPPAEVLGMPEVVEAYVG